MNSEEHQEIIQFLREQKYPDTVQDSRQTRWNYKRKLSSYFHCRMRHTFHGKILFIPRK